MEIKIRPIKINKFNLRWRKVRLGFPSFFLTHFSFSKLFEIPSRLNFLGFLYEHIVFSNDCKLNLINWMTITHINNLKCSSNNVLSFLNGKIGIPLISNQSLAKMFSKSSKNEIFFNQSSIKINTSKYAFIIFKTCNNSVIIIWIKFITLLITNMS